MGEDSSGAGGGYALFRDKLKHSSAQPIILQLHNFVSKFPTGLTRLDAARRVHRFLTSMQEIMLTDCVVFAAEPDEEGRSNTAEGLEKFLLSRLHPKLFAAEDSDEADDEDLYMQIVRLQWVDFVHLGIPPVDPTLLQLTVDELRRIDAYKAPRDKLVCILNACRVINDVLQRTLEEQGLKARPLSADDFIPLLIFSTIKANPRRLNSNLEFITNYRHPSRLVGEDAYFLTALHSAAQFLKDSTPKSFDVTAEEFEEFCNNSLEAFEASREPDDREAAAADAAVAPAEAMTVADKAATLPVELQRQLRAKLEMLPHRFEAVQSGRQLRLGDISGLLAEYKELVDMIRQVDGSVPSAENREYPVSKPAECSPSPL